MALQEPHSPCPRQGSHTDSTHVHKAIYRNLSGPSTSSASLASPPKTPIDTLSCAARLFFSDLALRSVVRHTASCGTAKGQSWAVSEHPFPRGPGPGGGDLPLPPIQAGRCTEVAAIIRISPGFRDSFNCIRVAASGHRGRCKAGCYLPSLLRLPKEG